MNVIGIIGLLKRLKAIVAGNLSFSRITPGTLFFLPRLDSLVLPSRPQVPLLV
jgi:hypothetical protein